METSDSSSRCFISGDWGTSTLRLRLVQSEPFRILEEVSSAGGIAATHEAWMDRGGDRYSFYLDRLHETLGLLSGDVEGVPMLLSGMASSSVGIEEVPYAVLPFRLDVEGLACRRFAPTSGFPHQVTLIGGLRWLNRDVMRGEECQALGLSLLHAEDQSRSDLPASFRLILPGTHSKHLLIDRGSIVRSQTFLTGDLFRALAGHSILRHSVTGKRQPLDREAFRAGVEVARQEGCLASLFGVRCRDLLEGVAPEENNAFLSGVLVGGELVSLPQQGPPLVMAADDLGSRYLEALDVLGFQGEVHRIPEGLMAAAVPRAHLLVHLGR